MNVASHDRLMVTFGQHLDRPIPQSPGVERLQGVVVTVPAQAAGQACDAISDPGAEQAERLDREWVVEHGSYRGVRAGRSPERIAVGQQDP